MIWPTRSKWRRGRESWRSIAQSYRHCGDQCGRKAPMLPCSHAPMLHTDRTDSIRTPDNRGDCDLGGWSLIMMGRRHCDCITSRMSSVVSRDTCTSRLCSLISRLIQMQLEDWSWYIGTWAKAAAAEAAAEKKMVVGTIRYCNMSIRRNWPFEIPFSVHPLRNNPTVKDPSVAGGFDVSMQAFFIK